MSGASQTVTKNALWNVGGLVWSIVLSFGSIPIFMAYLGPRDYGIWSLAASSIGALSVLQFGLGEATTKYIAQYEGQSDAQAMNDVVGATLLLYGAIGVIASAALWLLAEPMAIYATRLEGQEAQKAAEVYRIAALGFFPFIAQNAAQGIFNGQQRFDRSSRLTILKRSLETLLGLSCVIAGYGLLTLVWVGLGVLWFILILSLWLGLRSLPGRGFRLQGSLAAIPRVFSFGMLTTLRTVGQLPFGILDRLVIGATLGPEAVAYYSVPANVAQRYFALVCVEPTRALMPYFSRAQARANEDGELREAAFKSWRVSILLALLVAVPCLAAAPWFMQVWMGQSFAKESTWALVGLFVAHIALASLVVSHQLAIGLGRLKVYTFWTLTAGVGTLIALWLASSAFGVAGAAFALTAYALLHIPFAPVAAHFVGGRFRDLLPGFSGLLVVALLAVFAGFGVGWLLAPLHLWLAMLAAGLAATLVLVLAYMLLWRKCSDPYSLTLRWLAGRFLPKRLAPNA